MSATKRRATASTTKRTTKRTAKSGSSTSWLYPRRRRSRPGLATTVGTALGTLAVTTLLDASWPVRIGLVVVALVIGLVWVVFKNRREIAKAAGAATPTDPAPEASADPAAGSPTAGSPAETPPVEPPTDPAA